MSDRRKIDHTSVTIAPGSSAFPCSELSYVLFNRELVPCLLSGFRQLFHRIKVFKCLKSFDFYTPTHLILIHSISNFTLKEMFGHPELHHYGHVTSLSCLFVCIYKTTSGMGEEISDNLPKPKILWPIFFICCNNFMLHALRLISYCRYGSCLQ